MTEKKQKKTTPKLTVHGLLGALSYWGTAARFLLVSVIIVFAFLVNLSGDSTTTYIDTEIIFLIFGLATLILLDGGYVTAARYLPLNPVADRWVVMMSDLALASLFIVPSLIIMGSDGNKIRAISLIGALLIVSIRLLVGLLFAKRR